MGTSPYPTWNPRRAVPASGNAPKVRTRRKRPVVFALGGFLLGVMLTVLVLALLPPRGAPVVPSSSPGALSITLNDAILTQESQRAVAKAGLPFTLTNVRAHIAPNNLVSIAGTATTLVGSEQFAATTQISIAQGQLLTHLTSAQVGALPLPAAVTSQLDAAINAEIAQNLDAILPSDYGLVPHGVTTTSGQLTIDFALS